MNRLNQMNQMIAFGEYLFKWFIGSNNGAEGGRMGQNGAEWSRMEQNGAEWSRMEQNGAEEGG